MDPEKLKVSTTTDGKPPRPGFEAAGAPAPIDPRTGMHESYWVLSPEERAKGFVRPVRRSYRHVGRSVCGKPCTLDDRPGRLYVCGAEPGHEGECDITWFEVKDQAEQEKIGRAQARGGCGTVTTMGTALAETYARDPKYYGATFCCACGTHPMVGADGEFVWEWTTGRVGT